MTVTIASDISSVQHTLPSELQSRSFLEALTARRSINAISPISKISDESIIAIVRHALLHVPGAFNAQTCRCLVLLGSEAQNFWDNIGESIRSSNGEEAWNGFFAAKIAEYRRGYGTVAFFDDVAAWDQVSKTMNPKRWAGMKDIVPQWEEHSAGMHHYAGKEDTSQRPFIKSMFSNKVGSLDGFEPRGFRM
ncbi:MAG: hypothetical protein Q9162_004972 [Coniocarpon cinnabarinum]